MAFIIEADTPDELRIKFIRILEGNAERCKSHAATAITPELRNHFEAQGVAFRLLARDLRQTQIKPKPYDPFADTEVMNRQTGRTSKSHEQP